MTTVTIHEAEANLSTLMARVLAGEDVVIARDQDPEVRLVPVEGASPPRKRRQPGSMKGMFEVDDAAFAPLTDEELKDWGI